MSKSKETMTKKQPDDLASNLNNLAWPLPMGFPSMPPFGSFPPFGLPTSSFPSSSTGTFPPPPPLSSLLPNDSNSATPADPWTSALAATGASVDYNEYAKQLSLFMNTFTEQQPQKSETEKSKGSKSSKSKSMTSSLPAVDPTHEKASASKTIDEPHARPTSTSSSSSSRRSTSTNPKKSTSHSKSSNPNSHAPSSSKTSTGGDSTALDPLAFAAAAASGGLPFPYFLPSMLSQSAAAATTSASPSTYPFSSLSSSLLNPAASLYPFLSPDWLTSSAKLMEGFSGLATDKSTDSKESTSLQTHKSKQSHKQITSEAKHSSALDPLLNESLSSSKAKKRAKSIRSLTEEHDLQREAPSPLNSTRKSSTGPASLLHSALTESSNGNGFYENFLNLSRRSSNNDTASHHQSAEESRSNEDDDSDPNPKRRKTDEVNEALLRIPLSRGWKRVTIARAITRTGVRGDVAYYAPCGRKLRSFQEIDRYLSKKHITDLDRSNFTFSSKVHIGYFHEPKEGPDGKTIFHESTEDEIVNRITAINPKFRRIRFDYEGETPTKSSTASSHANGMTDSSPSNMIQQMHDDNRKLRLEQKEMAKRAAEIKTQRDAIQLLRNMAGDGTKAGESVLNAAYSHNDFLKAIVEQQKFVQQHEFEHQHKLQQEQQEQERKRQELSYLKQLESKKKQEEKLQLLEQRRIEKDVEREKKIREKYMEIVLAKEMKRVAEDMQLRDLPALPILKPVENMRFSIEAFASALVIIQFLNNFKRVLHIPDNLIPTLNSLQQSSSSRDINSLCQVLLNIALEDPGIPNPKKGLTSLGQRLSEIDVTEHTFSEVLRLYIRERNGFEDKITQSLSDASFQSLMINEKVEILAFLCNDLSANRRIVDEVDRHVDELTALKHEKLEIERRLRRLKFDKSLNSNSNNLRKLSSLGRDKDVNSSDNESPDDSDEDSVKNDEQTTAVIDPAADAAADQDIETIDETKIDDVDKRLTLVNRKYTLIKRRVIDKHSHARALHLGQDRYRRQYWYFAHLPGIYVEGLSSGDTCPNDIKDAVENAARQKLDRTGEVNPPSRPTQRKKQPARSINPTTSPPASVNPAEPSATMDLNQVKSEISDTEDECKPQQQLPLLTTLNESATEDLATMDLSAFCMAAKQNDSDEAKPPNGTDEPLNEVKSEPKEEVEAVTHKRGYNDVTDDSLPLDLSCSKPKRACEEDYWTSQHAQAAHLLPPASDKYDPSLTLNGFSANAALFSNVKQEHLSSLNFFHMAHANLPIAADDFAAAIKQESLTSIYKQIEQSVREKNQYPQALPIPEDAQSGWWLIQTEEELRTLIKSLAKRGQRERHLRRMLQRYSDVIINSMKQHAQANPKTETSSPRAETDAAGDQDEQTPSSENGFVEQETDQLDDTHQMDVLNEIYDLLDRIISSSLQCRTFDQSIARPRLTQADIQAKGSEVLDEAKHLLAEVERNIERRYLKPPFVRKNEINLSSIQRANQNSAHEHSLDESSEDIAASTKHDEVPQQLERWRRAVAESRTPAQLALCLAQLERCIAWERSIIRVYCEICNSDNDEEKLLLCDGCDHGTHTYCFRPPMSFIPPNDWYCYVCIAKAKGENLCFVCGNKGDHHLHRCEHCGKLFHEECLKNAKQQRGRWFCVLCAANDPSVANDCTPTKSSGQRQTSRSINSRQLSNASFTSSTNGDASHQSPATTNTGRNRGNAQRKSKANTQENASANDSYTETTPLNDTNESSTVETNDTDDDVPSPTIGKAANNNHTKKNKKSKKPPPKKSTATDDAKGCRSILNELLKSDVVWPFQTPVDVKEHPEYYECIKNPMDFSTIKKKMRHHQYAKRDEFLHDVELILNNCEYFNEDESPVGQAGHLLRALFQSQWAKQFG